MTRSPRRHSVMAKAPEPMGVSAYFSGPSVSKPFLDSTEAIGKASVARNGAVGCFSLIVTVFGSVASTVSITLKGSAQSEPSSSRMRVRLNTTSSAVRSEPSENFASRSLSV